MTPAADDATPDGPVAGDPTLEAAIEAVDDGDLATLDRLLAAEPDLVHRRVQRDDGMHAGYFARPQLLHHVAGNPQRPRPGRPASLPDNIVEVTRRLLAAGAEVDAPCGGGPEQPHSTGTTLGLVASSALAAEGGHARPLIEVLVGAGAGVDGVAVEGADLDGAGGEGNGTGRAGSVLYLALYHVVECRAQREAAEALMDAGAQVDLGFAAGLGRVDLMRRFVGPDGALDPDAYRLYRAGPGWSDGGLTDPDRVAVLTDALVLAAMNGRDEAVTWLLEQGAPLDGWQPVGAFRVTALHAAAWAGWPGTVALLLRRGADATLREPAYDGTPADWAEHCHRAEALAVLRSARS